MSVECDGPHRQSGPQHHAAGAERVAHLSQPCLCLQDLGGGTPPAALDAKNDGLGCCPDLLARVRPAVGAGQQVSTQNDAELRLNLVHLDRASREAVARCLDKEPAKEWRVNTRLALSSNRAYLVAPQTAEFLRGQRVLLHREVDLVQPCDTSRRLWITRRAVNPLLVCPGLHERICRCRGR